jgi:hypothetical protein
MSVELDLTVSHFGQRRASIPLLIFHWPMQPINPKRY